MTDRELMQMALNALEAMQSYAAAENKGLRICDEAIEALRARLAQPEPVAMVQIAEDYHAHVIWMEGVNPVDLDQKFLYTAPPQREWQGLTEAEHTQIAIDCGCASADWVFYSATIERKLREKNT